MKCWNCNRDNPDGIKECFFCGAVQKEQAVSPKERIGIVKSSIEPDAVERTSDWETEERSSVQVKIQPHQQRSEVEEVKYCNYCGKKLLNGTCDCAESRGGSRIIDTEPEPAQVEQQDGTEEADESVVEKGDQTAQADEEDKAKRQQAAPARWLQQHIDRDRLLYSFLGSFIFYMAGNGFECVNFIPRYDALNYVQHFANFWEIRLGRFLQPLYGQLRGNLQMPWLIGMLSILYISLAVYFLSGLLKIKDRVLIMLIGGVLADNLTITELNTSFSFLVDAFMLSMLCAVLGVYLIDQKSRLLYMLLASLSFFVAIGMYQAFVTVAAVTVLLAVLKDILSHRFDLKMFLRWVCYVLSLLLSAVWYYFFYKEEMFRYQVEATSGYNSLSNLTKDFSHGISEILGLIGKNYLAYVKFFWHGGREDVSIVSIFCNYILLAILIFCLYRLFRERELGFVNLLWLFFILLCLPFATMIVSIGMGNPYIMYRVCYAIFFLYVLIIGVVSHFIDCPGQECCQKQYTGVIKGLTVICLVVVLFNNIRYSNGAYVLQKILYDRTLSYVTKISDDINALEGFDSENMPVVIVGNINSDDIFDSSLLDGYKNLSGFENTSVTYQYNQTVTSYLSFMRKKLKIEEELDVTDQYASMAEVEAMPVYPHQGYCRIVNNVVVVKFPR